MKGFLDMWQFFLIFCFFVPRYAWCMIDGLYCGHENCYEVLGVERDATRVEIAKAYRQLARKFHPDVHKVAEDKPEAEKKFRAIATAYEILKDDDSRSDYDYMLDHPDEVYSHYYRYYRRRMTPKVDVRIVILVSILIVSLVQYYVAWQRYDTAIKYLMTVPKYRNRALEYAKMEGLLSKKNSRGGLTNKLSKAESREEVEAIIRKVLENNMDIRGGYAKPKMTDIVIFQLLLFPVYMFNYVRWYIGWVWKYNVRKCEYGEQELLYLIRKNMKLAEVQFEQYSEEEKAEFLRLQLWKKDLYKRWKEQKEEQARRQMAENGRYKSYRRYIKNHGPGRMTFDDS